MKATKIKSIAIAVISVIVLLILDQVTKLWAYNSLRVNGGISLIKGVLAFTYLENTGAAWGIMKGSAVLFVIVAVFISAACAWVYVRMPEERKFLWLRIILVMLVSGAIGNVIDRLIRHFVVDFISFELINFPIFNVADIYITCSAILLVLLIFFYYKEEDLAFLQKSNDR